MSEMAEMLQQLRRKRAKKAIPAAAAVVEEAPTAVDEEPSDVVVAPPPPSPSKMDRKRRKEDDEDDDVHAEESYCDAKGLKPLFTIKRAKAVMTRHGFSMAQPAALTALDAYLKSRLKEVVGRAIIGAACHRRKKPNRQDGIVAIQGAGGFPSVFIG